MVDHLRSATTTKEELHFAATGLLSDQPQFDSLKTYGARLHEADARKAEAFAFVSSALDPLEKLRTLIFRGKISEAREYLAEIADDENLGPQSLSEIQLERGRIESLDGNWYEALEAANSGLAIEGAAPMTRMNLLQIRSVAFFELGQFRRSADDLELIEALAPMFPYLATPFYATILEARVLARNVGVTAAREKLEKTILAAQSRQRLSRDVLLSYLYARIELGLMERESDVLTPILAYLGIAVSIGNKFYMELGHWMIAFITGDLSREGSYQNYEYARVKSLCSAVREGRAVYESAKPFIQFAPLVPRINDQGEDVRSLLVSSSQLLIHILPYRVHSLAQKSQIFRALSCLSRRGGGLRKEDFFRQVWNLKKFSPDLNDEPIRTLLHRIRKLYGIDIQSQNGRVVLKGVLHL